MADSQDPTLRIRGVLDLTDARRELAAFSVEGDKGALLVPRAGAGIPNATGGGAVATSAAVAQAISPRRGVAAAEARDAARRDDIQFQTELAEARTPEFRLQLLGSRRDSLDANSIARAKADLAFTLAESRLRTSNERRAAADSRSGDRADDSFSDALRSLGRQEIAAGSSGRREAARLAGAKSPDENPGFLGPLLSSAGTRIFAVGALLNTARQFGGSIEAQRQAGYDANAADDPLSFTAAQRAGVSARYSNPFLRAANFGDSLGGLIAGPREQEIRRLDERARAEAASNRNFELNQRSDVAEAGFRGLASGGLVGQQRAGIEAGGAAQAGAIQRRIGFLEESNRRNPTGADANRRSNELDQLRRSLDVALEATQNNLRIFDRQQSLVSQGEGVGAADASDIASGVDSREAARRSLNRRQALESANVKLSNPALLDAVERRQDAERSAFEFGAGRQDTIANLLNAGRSASARGRLANDPFSGQLAAFGASSQAELADPNLPAAQRPGVETRQNAELAALVGQAIRGAFFQQVAVGGQADVLTAQLGRDPLGATLAGIRSGTRQRLLATDSLPDFGGILGGFSPRRTVQNAIRGVGSQEEELAAREFNEGIGVARIGSRGRLESSRLRAEGRGPSAGANDILSGTLQQAQELANRGGAFAGLRQDVLGTGVNQLKALRRQVEFGGFGESADPGSIGPNPGTDTRADQENVPALLKQIDDSVKELTTLLANG